MAEWSNSALIRKGTTVTARVDTTVTASIVNGTFMGRNLLTRQEAREARTLGLRVVQVFSAEFEDATVIGSASAAAVLADVRHRVAVQSGTETALNLFGSQSYGTRANGKTYLVPSPSEKAAMGAMRTGGMVIATALGTVRLDCHGWIVV